MEHAKQQAPALLFRVPNGPIVQIAVVTETYPPELNGVASTVARLVDGLRSHGHQIDLVRPRQRGEGQSGEALLTAGVPLPMYRDLRVGLVPMGRLRDRWQQSRPDVVHIATEGPLGWSALRAARRLQIPVTSDFRTHYDRYSAHYGFGWARRLVSGYLRRFHNLTDRTFVPTATLRRELAARGYHRLEVVGRGVDTRRFAPDRRADELRLQWGADEQTPVLLYVGRLASEKNVPLALRAFDAVRARVPAAQMVVVGDGPQAARLQREHPQVRFVGRKSGDELARHYASADVFLFPSVTDTFGNVTLEALASGMLVVAFNSGAAAVHIEDGKSGLLATAGDEQGFIAAACALTQQCGRLSSMRVAARQAAEAASWDAVISRFEYFLADCADANATPLARSCPA